MTRQHTEKVPAVAIHEESSSFPPFPRALINSKPWRAQGGILLTGGTGFLGRELVTRLLARGGDESIYLLIRGHDDAEVQRRFLELSHFWGSRWQELDRMRVLPVRGDLTLPWLGLDRKVRQDLAGRITHIVHSGASINLNSSLEKARETNLGGTWEILQLAKSCPRLQSLAWISTAFVAGDRRGLILEEELQCGQKFHNAYEQSKFEAELMVRSFKTLLPITIFRPSIIVGDSRDGHTCDFKSIYLPLHLIADGVLRCVSGNPLTPLDIVPVDYVADAILNLIGQSNSIGRCYQLVAGLGGTITAQELLNRTIRYFDDGGRPLHFIPSGAQIDARLHAFFTYLNDNKEFDDSATRAALQGTNLLCPRITDYLDRLFAFCKQTNWGQGNIAGPVALPFHIFLREHQSCITSV